MWWYYLFIIYVERFSSKDPVCRICLEKITPDQIKLENNCHPDSPICAPCKCAGSIKYIHRDCLKVIISIIYLFLEMDLIKKKYRMWIMSCNLYTRMGKICNRK